MVTCTCIRKGLDLVLQDPECTSGAHLRAEAGSITGNVIALFVFGALGELAAGRF